MIHDEIPQRHKLIPEVIPRRKGHINIGPVRMSYGLPVTWKLKKNKRTSTYTKFLLLNLE
jgi:hypothetical protein